MSRKLLLVSLAIITLALLALTIVRMSMPYNENGLYFDGLVTYSRDAVVAYGVIASILLLATCSLVIRWKKTNP